jgi:hypothetical protein
MSEYSITPQAYSARAGRLLRRKTPDHAFYVAYELRCAIEARAREYLAACDLHSSKYQKAWQADRIMKAFERVIGKDVTPIHLTFMWKGKRLKGYLSFKPIDKEMLRDYGNLGNYLHAQKRTLTRKDLVRVRAFLIKLHRRLEYQLKSNMLLPPDWTLECVQCHRLIKMNQRRGFIVTCDCGAQNYLKGREMKIEVEAVKTGRNTVELRQIRSIRG